MSAKNDRATWIKGDQATCNVLPAGMSYPFRFILLGAPGVGKGTQAELLCQRLGTCHLSTGDIFRAAKCLNGCERSPAMDEALGYMQRGELVPDETVLNLVRERSRCLRCGGGFLLDGFPRTVAQAEALTDILWHEKLPLTSVLNYELPIATIVERLSGRRTCSKCKAVFHVSARPPHVEGTCDHCGGRLFQREDDCPVAIQVRMEAYEKSTRPLIEYFRVRWNLVNITADGTPEEIFTRTLAALQIPNTSVATGGPCCK